MVYPAVTLTFINKDVCSPCMYIHTLTVSSVGNFQTLYEFSIYNSVCIHTLTVSSEGNFLTLYEFSIFYYFCKHTLTVSSEGNFLILYEFSKALMGCTVLGLPSFIPKYNPIGLAIKLQ